MRRRRPFLLAFIVGLSLLARPARSEDGPYNYADLWKSWSGQSRDAYLMGFKDGGDQVYVDTALAWLPRSEILKKPETLRVKEAREKTMLLFDSDALVAVMSDLYKDPANAFVRFSRAVRIARDKLRGMDVEPALRKAREFAIRESELFGKPRTQK